MNQFAEIEGVLGKIDRFFLTLWKGSSDISQTKKGPDDPSFWKLLYNDSFSMKPYSKTLFEEEIKTILQGFVRNNPEEPDRIIPLTIFYADSPIRVCVWGYATVCYPFSERTECFKYHIEATMP